MPSHYIELTVATTQFFARCVFVKAAKWESNWAQEEEEVYNEQSAVIQTFSVFSDNLVDSFMEIWPHLFFQVNNPKPLKVKSSWNRENSRLTGQDGFKKKRFDSRYLLPLSAYCDCWVNCSAVIPATFITSVRCCKFGIASSKPLWKHLSYHQLWGLTSTLFPTCFRSLLIAVFAGCP